MAAPNKETFIPIKTTLPIYPLPSAATRGQILTPRLLLRGLSQDDLEAYHTLRTDPEIMKWTVQGRPDRDLAETQEKLDLFLPPNDVLKSNWAICLRESGEFIGIGGVHIFASTFGWPELGYMIRREYWGRGLATEFLRGFVGYWTGTCSVPSLGEGGGGNVIESASLSHDGRRLEREEVVIFVDARTVEGAAIGSSREIVKVKKPDGEGDQGEDKEMEMEIPIVEEQLIAITSEHNGKSQTVLRKNGFKEFVTWVGTDGDGTSVGLPTFRYFPGRAGKQKLDDI